MVGWFWTALSVEREWNNSKQGSLVCQAVWDCSAMLGKRSCSDNRHSCMPSQRCLKMGLSVVPLSSKRLSTMREFPFYAYNLVMHIIILRAKFSSFSCSKSFFDIHICEKRYLTKEISVEGNWIGIVYHVPSAFSTTDRPFHLSLT